MISFERSNNGVSAINLTFLAGRNSQLGYTNGIASLTSQILLNGSKSFKKKAILYKSSQMGGAINIGTSDNFTSINARCLDGNIFEMTEMLFSMIFESGFNDIEKQKRITREINSNSMNDPYKVLLDRLYQKCTDRQFSLRLGNDFNEIEVSEIMRFHKEKYIDPSISIIAQDSSMIDFVHNLCSRYHINRYEPKTYSDSIQYNFNNDFDEFKWNNSTNNRMILSFVVDYSAVYDILSSVYQYKMNKIIRMEKALCARNRCTLLPFGYNKRIFVFDIEFNKYENKDEIINTLLDIINGGYTESEFCISKSQLIGDMLYNLCDPVKFVLANSERTVLGHSTIERFKTEIMNVSYKDAIETKFGDFNCTIGVR